MITRTLEYQYNQEQKRYRVLALALEGVPLAIQASGAVSFKNETGHRQADAAFQRFVDSLKAMENLPETEAKFTLARLKVMYGSRWREYADLLREEDRDKI